MNGPAPSSATAARPAVVPPDTAAIDASCRALLLPVVGSVKWLVLSVVFALITSIKLHSPTFLANCSWLTYGHTLAAARDAFAYGFASQAGLAIALWMLCRLGRSLLAGPLAISIAVAFWNLGVALGVLGILAGDSTGFEWLEFPRYGSAPMFGAYVVIGICALLTFANRGERELYPSQWYILGALFWFPWIYTTARLLLVIFPVRGVMQVVVNGWFASSFLTLWLGAIGVAVLYYFIPKLSGQPLFSRALAIFGFWTLAAFGCWGGLYPGLPLPSWIISLSVAVTVLLVVPLIATVMNLWSTFSAKGAMKAPLFGFFKCSLIFFLLGSVLHIGMMACTNGVRLTLFGEGVELLLLYGFIGFAFFGAIYYLVPKLTGEVVSERLVSVTCWCTLLGVLLFSGPLLIGGTVQGAKLGDGTIPFLEVMNSTKAFLRVSTIGLLLLLIGNSALCWSVLAAARRCCCAGCCAPAETNASGRLKPVKAR